MKFFKYLFFLTIFFSTYSNALTMYTVKGHPSTKSPTHNQACSIAASILSVGNVRAQVTISSPTLCELGGTSGEYSQYSYRNILQITSEALSCPSATQLSLRVPSNSSAYVCESNCQVRLTICVDIEDSSPIAGGLKGMSCSAISTGKTCGATGSTVQPTPQKPDTGGNPPITSDGANQNNDGSNPVTNSANTSSTSTSTTTNNTTNETTTTTTTTNSTTSIDTSSLENTIGNGFDKVIDKFKCLTTGDCPKDGQGNGEGEDGEGDGEFENPFGDGVVPEREITEQSFKTNLYSSNAQCPGDIQLRLPLFGGHTFSYSFSFSQWCSYLAIFGNIVLIFAYFFGAYIIVSKT